MRFTALGEAVYHALSEALLVCQLYETPISLSGSQWQVTAVSVGEDGQEEAGLSSPAVLWRRAIPQSQVTLRWLSPTAFHQSKHHLLLPLPRPTFVGLVQKWCAFAQLPLPDDLLDFIEAHVVAEAHKLRTRAVRFASYQIHGFMGWCRFRALEGTPTQWQALNALARFAFYAGTGHKTTMGFGQTLPGR